MFLWYEKQRLNFCITSERSHPLVFHSLNFGFNWIRQTSPAMSAIEASRRNGQVSLRRFDGSDARTCLREEYHHDIFEWHRKISPRVAALSQTGVSEY